MLDIQRIVLREIRLPLREPFKISSGVVSERRICLLELTDGDGTTGWSECVAGEQPNYSAETIDTAWHALGEWLTPRVLGAHFDHPSAVIGALDKNICGHNMAKASIEMGCWDVAARKQNVPLAHMLGGARDRVSTGISIGIQADPDALAHRAQRAFEQ
ncbi:MAG TPA: o-succinylbenzoate synthase, partial [Gemmatimonadaceae bacterium]